MPARHRTDRGFGDTAAIDLLALPDLADNQLSFINILDLARTFGVVAMIPSKHPKVVWDCFLTLALWFWRAAKVDLRPRRRIRA